MNQCTTCWQKVAEDAKICPECGERIVDGSIARTIGGIILWLGKGALVLFVGAPVVAAFFANIEIAKGGYGPGVGLVFAYLIPLVIMPGVFVGWILGQIIRKLIRARKATGSKWRKDTIWIAAVLFGAPFISVIFEEIWEWLFGRPSSGMYLSPVFVDSVLLVLSIMSIWTIIQISLHERKNYSDRGAGEATTDSKREIESKSTMAQDSFLPLWPVVKWLLIALIGVPFFLGLLAVIAG